MEKKIYTSMLFLVITGILAVTILLSAVFYFFYTDRMKDEARMEVSYVSKSLSYQDDATAYLKALRLSRLDDRVTLVSPSGQVLFDNYEKILEMENHSGRPEISQALETGYGEDKRFSSTLHQDTLYFAVRLEDGSVLRIAKTSDGILRVFLTLLPPVLLIALLIVIFCHFYSRRLTKQIVAPIRRINLLDESTAAYEELTPFLQTIAQQKSQIESQFLALEARTSTLQTVISNMREGLIMLDMHGDILSANASAARLLDGTPEDFLGKNILFITRRRDLIENVRAALSGAPGDHTLEFGGKTVHVFFDPIIQNGETTAAIVLFLDITESANAEKIRHEFTANVSHELKTPLTVISGLSEMMELNMARPEDLATFIKKIRNEIQRMIALIEDILKLSELDEGTLRESDEQFDLSELAMATAASLSPLAEEKKIRIGVTGGPVQIEANKNQLQELLYNLIDNAIKYNKPCGRITVSISSCQDQAIIEVADTGIGIAQEYLDRIFERFYRVDKSRSRKTGGTGLGLSIVKNIAKSHGGHVEIESAPGDGTRVRVVLPLH